MKYIMKKHALLILMLMIVSLVHAQNHWTPDESIYPNTMSVVAVIAFDDNEQKNASLEIAAFCGDELRGARKPQYIQKYDRYFVFLTIYGNDNDVLTFKIFDHEINSELNYYNSENSITFKTDKTMGNIIEPIVINFVSDGYKTFIGNGFWNDAENWENGLIPTIDDKAIINGIAIIPNGIDIIIDQIIINKNNSLSIENGASLSVLSKIINEDVESLIINDGGQIFQNNDDVFATFNKYIVRPVDLWGNPDKTGWQFISSPIINNAITNFLPASGDYDFYKYDGNAILQWVNYKKHLHDDFETEFINGTGYLVSYETETIAPFKGILFNDKNFDFSLSFNESDRWGNFTLIGNPFPFNMNWEKFAFGEIIDAYATVNPETGAYIYQKEGEIKVGEGVMIYSTSKDAYLSYDHNTKTRNTDIPNYINVIASGNNGYDNVIINFDENEKECFPKLENFNDEIANIYVNISDIQYAIVNCDYSSQEIPLCFDAKNIGNYTLTFDFHGEFENVYLIDNKTGKNINMLTEKQYTFISRNNDRHDRFIVKIGKMDEDSSEDSFVYIENGEIIINDINGDATINIYNVTGQILLSTKDTNIPTAGVDTGVYLIQKIDDKGVKVQKLTIN